MQNRSDNTFDKLVKAKFENFRSEPRAELWEQISTQLDQKPKSSKLSYVWLTAACLLIFGSYVVWISSSNPASPIPQLVQNRIASKPVEQLQPTSQKVVPQKAVSATIKQTSAMQQPLLKQEQWLASQEVVTERLSNSMDSPVMTTEDQPEAIAAIVESPIIANTEAVKSDLDQHPEEESSTKHRARGLGRLVNFVVSQVDGRADKLIEVSEDPGEGLRITGLNIGLIKMKNKNPN